MVGRRTGEVRRRTCVIPATCQRKPRSNALVRQNAPDGPHQRRPASSSAKRWITFAKASTAHDRRSRRSRSGCRRRARLASTFPRPRGARLRSVLAAPLRAPCARDAIHAKRPRHVRAPPLMRSNAKGTGPRPRRHSRSRHAAAHESVRRPLDVRRRGERREPRDRPFAVLPRGKRRQRAVGDRRPDSPLRPEFDGTGRAIRSAC